MYSTQFKKRVSRRKKVPSNSQFREKFFRFLPFTEFEAKILEFFLGNILFCIEVIMISCECSMEAKLLTLESTKQKLSTGIEKIFKFEGREISGKK